MSDRERARRRGETTRKRLCRKPHCAAPLVGAKRGRGGQVIRLLWHERRSVAHFFCFSLPIPTPILTKPLGELCGVLHRQTEENAPPLERGKLGMGSNIAAQLGLRESDANPCVGHRQ
jgi:hypothetical protein